MRLKLGFFLTVCLLVCLSACASTNSSDSQAPATSTNSTASQPGGVPPAGGANQAGVVATPTATTEQHATTGIDACSLITNKEVAAVVGGAIKEAKSSQRADGEFLMSQCFYTAEEFARSVSLSVVQPDPANPTKQPRQYFTEKFSGAGEKPEAEREKEREKAKAGKKEEAGQERGEEEEEEGGNAERISGVGDQAFWVKSGPSASLYALKKNQFLILSIGGGDAEPIRLKKTKALAQQALKRMK